MFNPNPIALSFFGINIYWYGITMASAVLVGILIAMRAVKLYKWKQDDVLDFVIFAIPCGIIGARLYYVFFEWQRYALDPMSIFRIWEGGLALYGSLIGAMICALVFCKIKKLSFLELADIGIPCFAIGQAIGRWGNFFNQEAYGAQITNPNLMWFPFAVRIDATNTIHYATFFYESMWCLLIGIFLILMRKKFRHKGDALIAYLALYGFERMIVEGLRTDSLYIPNTEIRVSQLISFIGVIAVIIFVLVRHFKEKDDFTISNIANPYYNLSLREAKTLKKESKELHQEIEAPNVESTEQELEINQQADNTDSIQADEQNLNDNDSGDKN